MCILRVEGIKFVYNNKVMPLICPTVEIVSIVSKDSFTVKLSQHKITVCREWTVGPPSSLTCPPIFMQLTGQNNGGIPSPAFLLGPVYMRLGTSNRHGCRNIRHVYMRRGDFVSVIIVFKVDIYMRPARKLLRPSWSHSAYWTETSIFRPGWNLFEFTFISVWT